MPLEPRVASPLQLWAGVECTVNRVGGHYFDQLELNGHSTRLSDLNLFAELGVRALRYPVLWERTAPHELEQADWSWADERLARLRELRIRPIVGLVHHGSGPRHTSLVDAQFPEKLAAYARLVALRYEWVQDYTPVNEPLTTARFSGLYGHWYPHGRDERVFATALFNQIRATVLAMRAIREVNPRARLVQTEDLGKTFSTRTLSYQAEHENERRWLTFDLLCGRVVPGHPMWTYFSRVVGVEEKELAWFAENPCPPDLIGINHYLTSERFLDERITRYPSCTHGGNEHHTYADVEAVRVCAEGLAGPRVLLREAWERFGLPLAITECHLGCTREEQLRWFKEVWDSAQSLRSDGTDVRAVTAWSMLGAFDWCNLLTRAEGRYESGVYDVRSAEPRPTALARMISDLAQGRGAGHPVLDAPGWWRRMERLQYPPVVHRAHTVASVVQGVSMNGRFARPLLITGASGTLGRAFARICEMRGLAFRLLTRREMDIADAASVEAALDEFDPWAVINAAGYVRVDDAESDAERCFRENFCGPSNLAAVCAERNISFVTFSSDLVFDGAKGSAYVESDGVSPLNVYGRSKAEAEERVLALHSGALLIRASAFFGPWDEYNFVTVALRELSSAKEFIAAGDALVSPTYVPDLVNASLDLLIDGERGIWHLANVGEISWAELARRAANLAGLNEREIVARQTSALGFAAARPLYSVLASERGTLMPTLDDALARYMRDCEMRWVSERESMDMETKPRAMAASSGMK